MNRTTRSLRSARCRRGFSLTGVVMLTTLCALMLGMYVRASEEAEAARALLDMRDSLRFCRECVTWGKIERTAAERANRIAVPTTQSDGSTAKPSDHDATVRLSETPASP